VETSSECSPDGRTHVDDSVAEAFMDVLCLDTFFTGR
jgi:hypothetical protein